MVRKQMKLFIYQQLRKVGIELPKQMSLLMKKEIYYLNFLIVDMMEILILFLQHQLILLIHKLR